MMRVLSDFGLAGLIRSELASLRQLEDTKPGGKASWVSVLTFKNTTF
jgi:hypothetical protein